MPAPVEEPVEIHYDDEPVVLNRVRKPVAWPEISEEDKVRMARELEQYQLRSDGRNIKKLKEKV